MVNGEPCTEALIWVIVLKLGCLGGILDRHQHSIKNWCIGNARQLNRTRSTDSVKL